MGMGLYFSFTLIWASEGLGPMTFHVASVVDRKEEGEDDEHGGAPHDGGDDGARVCGG
jgi:hypothetical protein